MSHRSHNHSINFVNNDKYKDRNDNQLYNILNGLKDYMFDCKNIRQFTKHNIDFVSLNETTSIPNKKNNVVVKSSSINVKNVKKDAIYRPKQKDTLFWCFYIFKYGLSKYEMEIGNKHFLIEKQEKIKYIELLRENKYKDILKTHKIKPLTSIEDDLANHDIISIKTFFALCIIENINIILIDKRKLYETIVTDDPKIHVINRDILTHSRNDFYIELDVSNDTINKYRDTYYKMVTFDVSLKSMSSYKLDELLELCKKLNINTNTKEKEKDNNTKKLTKKDIYEMLVLHF